LRGIDLAVHGGEIFGLIGPDGAGKTTTFHILAGIMEPTAGTASLLGRRPRDARADVGYLTQRFSLFLDLSVDENLRYAAGVRDVTASDLATRRERYLRLLDLDRAAGRLAAQLSGGMKQKLALCAALIAEPRILLLDEPTTGVDPVSRREFWRILARLADGGMTIVVATPYLDEAERCHRIALIHEGTLRALGTPAEIRASLPLQRLEIRTANAAAAEGALQAEAGSGAIADVQGFGDRVDVLVADAAAGTAAVRATLAAR
jgi:ABC-2 type transport system ATP-binding protein